MGSSVLALVTMTTQLKHLKVLSLLSIFLLHNVNSLFFRQNPPRGSRNMEMDMTMMSTEVSGAKTGWGWSSWTEWSGACPSVCPTRCRTRERYCSGLCHSGQPIDLSDCPELQSAQPEDGGNGGNPESPFV